MTTAHRFLAALSALFCSAALAQLTPTAEPRTVLKGHDPVAYFTEGKPVMGSAQFAYDWDEARYYFANAANRALFVGNPDRYAPRFGGHCTASMTRGKENEGDPEFWAIVDGKLYMVGAGKGREAAMKAVERLKKDPEMIALAQKKWREQRR